MRHTAKRGGGKGKVLNQVPRNKNQTTWKKAHTALPPSTAPDDRQPAELQKVLALATKHSLAKKRRLFSQSAFPRAERAPPYSLRQGDRAGDRGPQSNMLPRSDGGREGRINFDPLCGTSVFTVESGCVCLPQWHSKPDLSVD